MPFPVILSAPSGGGKTSIAKRLLSLRNDVGYSVSCTTRAPREGEVEGQDYYFVTRTVFNEMRRKGAFAEWAEVHENLYGTLKSEVERVLGSGRHVVMDIDVEGTRQFASAFPESVLIFIVPPSPEALIQRLKARGSENSRVLATRLRSAVRELDAIGEYQYVILNDDLEQATRIVSAILDGEGAKTARIEDLNGLVKRITAGISHELKSISER